MTEHGLPRAASLEQGFLIGGKYRVEQVLGSGGMGIVVRALHTALEQEVAIKIMRPEMTQNSDAVARFLAEGRAAVRLKSEHVARVLDVGELETGQPFLVMEYLQGSDLGALIGRLSVSQVVDYVLQACEAIAEAHHLGIVHRDLKPENLFLSQDAYGSPCIKVLDFGISKVSAAGAASTDGRITRTQAVMGSPSYMSPEQMRSSRNADARSDIWAIGCILHELITGRVAWGGESMAELCTAVLTADAPRVRSICPEVPGLLEEVILRCLERDPNRRPQSIVELAACLAPFGGQHSQQAIRRLSGSGTTFPPVPGAMPLASSRKGAKTNVAWGQLASQVPPPPRSLGRTMVVGVATAVPIVVIGALLLVRDFAASPPVPQGFGGQVQSAASPPMANEVLSGAVVLVSDEAGSDSGIPILGPVSSIPSNDGIKPEGTLRPPVVGPKKRVLPPVVSTVVRSSASTTKPASTETDYGGRE